VVTVAGDRTTGIERVGHAFASCAVLLDVGQAVGDGESPDGFAIAIAQREATIAAQVSSAAVGRGDIVLVRSMQLMRCRQEGWGMYVGGPAPGVSFETIDRIRATEIAALATDTWGRRSGRTSSPTRSSRRTRSSFPHIDLYGGEMFDLDGPAARCADGGNYDCLLVAAPLRVAGGVGAPVNPIAVR
jgi:kynurenine formamidase